MIRNFNQFAPARFFAFCYFSFDAEPRLIDQIKWGALASRIKSRLVTISEIRTTIGAHTHTHPRTDRQTDNATAYIIYNGAAMEVINRNAILQFMLPLHESPLQRCTHHHFFSLHLAIFSCMKLKSDTPKKIDIVQISYTPIHPFHIPPYAHTCPLYPLSYLFLVRAPMASII